MAKRFWKEHKDFLGFADVVSVARNTIGQMSIGLRRIAKVFSCHQEMKWDWGVGEEGT